VSRASANILVGIVIGTCAIVVVTKVLKARHDQDAGRIAKKIGKRLNTLESRVDSSFRAVAG